MNPVTTTTLPLSGQFVAVYPGLDGSAYSATLKWVDGELYAYHGFKDEWFRILDHGYSPNFLAENNTIYIISED